MSTTNSIISILNVSVRSFEFKEHGKGVHGESDVEGIVSQEMSMQIPPLCHGNSFHKIDSSLTCMPLLLFTKRKGASFDCNKD